MWQLDETIHLRTVDVKLQNTAMVFVSTTCDSYTHTHSISFSTTVRPPSRPHFVIIVKLQLTSVSIQAVAILTLCVWLCKQTMDTYPKCVSVQALHQLYDKNLQTECNSTELQRQNTTCNGYRLSTHTHIAQHWNRDEEKTRETDNARSQF